MGAFLTLFPFIVFSNTTQTKAIHVLHDSIRSLRQCMEIRQQRTASTSCAAMLEIFFGTGKPEYDN
jgi:pyridoxal/pyridoxine/pyridoxamine kinase